MRAAAREERVLFEVAIVDRSSAHVAGAVGPSIQRGQRTVDAVEKTLGGVHEPPVLLDVRCAPGLGRAPPGSRHERLLPGFSQRRHRREGYLVARAPI